MIELLSHWLSNWDDMLAGAITWSILGHAVNTFPAPGNPYAAWLLATVQYAVGQRDRAKNGTDPNRTGQIPITKPPAKE